jgi:hypothetical protein
VTSTADVDVIPGTEEVSVTFGRAREKKTGEKKTGTFYVSINFCGRPMGRRLASNPKRVAVTGVHGFDPNGAPRFTLSRICCTSASVIDSLIHASHGSGRTTGPASIRGPRDDSTQRRALDHRQSSARVTNPARTGFRSTYRNTVRRCSSCSIGNALKRPCHTCPLDSCHW